VTWPNKKPGLPFSGHGWLNEENKRTLSTLMPVGAHTIVEVGTWMGLSARYMLDMRPQANLYAIDTWEGSIEHHAEPTWATMLPELWEQFLVDCWEYQDRIQICRGNSSDMIRRLSYLQPDLVYLDGGRAYEVVSEDIRAIRESWPGVLLVGDDWGWPGVRQAATESFGEEIYVDGNCWWTTARHHRALGDQRI